MPLSAKIFRHNRKAFYRKIPLGPGAESQFPQTNSAVHASGCAARSSARPDRLSRHRTYLPGCRLDSELERKRDTGLIRPAANGSKERSPLANRPAATLTNYGADILTVALDNTRKNNGPILI